MSYTTLYRKWRSRTFDEIRGQDAIIKTLKNQVANKRTSHAYLFCGTRGTGKTSVAKIMARAVNCENPVEGNPCNICEICQSILNDSSMNVQEIDAASNNGVDNIREIRQQVNYPPTTGSKKVYIIDEVHMLSSGAFNALLKTLEEPPEYVIFILATTEVQKIPITVLSRCQRYDFKRIEVSKISEHLLDICREENILIEEKAIQFISQKADGAMRDALSLLDECSAYYQNQNIRYDNVLEILGASDISIHLIFFQAMIRKDFEKVLEIVQELIFSGRELVQFTVDFIWFLRNLLIMKSTQIAGEILELSEENTELMMEEVARVSKEAILRYIRILSELLTKLKHSSQKRVLFEVEIIRLMTPQMEMELDSALERITQLEQNLENGMILKTPIPLEEKISQKIENKTIENKEKQVKLSQASYDDFMSLRKEWGYVIASLRSVNMNLFQDTILEAREDGSIEIIFGNKDTLELAKRYQAIEEIERYIEKIMGKHFIFHLIYKGEDKLQDIYYVTDEYLQNLIHMNIDIEE